MIGPFVHLCPEITAGDARRVAGWLEDGDTLKHLSDAPGISAAIRRALDFTGMGIVTHLFNQGGRFFIAEEKGDPVGFVRLAPGAGEMQIVLMVEKSRWGSRLGGAILREALKLAFFEMRAPKVVAVIHRDNHRSLQLFARAGSRRSGTGYGRATRWR